LLGFAELLPSFKAHIIICSLDVSLWILADILLCLALFGAIKEEHLVTSKYFGTILYTIDPGG
jgi:hypothetical protein